jgi:hypothetical protein
MFTIIFSLFSSIRQACRTRAALQTAILALRHQLLVLQRSSRGHRLPLSIADRLVWVWLSIPDCGKRWQSGLQQPARGTAGEEYGEYFSE